MRNCIIIFYKFLMLQSIFSWAQLVAVEQLQILLFIYLLLCLDAAFYLCDRLDHSVEINQPTREGNTLLHMAARTGNESLINYLIDRKADINLLYTSKVGLRTGNSSQVEHTHDILNCRHLFPIIDKTFNCLLNVKRIFMFIISEQHHYRKITGCYQSFQISDHRYIKVKY